MSTLCQPRANNACAPVDADVLDWHEAGLTVGQVAGRMNITGSAVRFYDDKGLITSDRTAGNQRRYRGDVLCRLAMIRVSQRVGLSIAQIRDALTELPADGLPSPDDWNRLSQRLQDTMHGHIDDFNRMLDELAGEVDTRYATQLRGRPGDP